MKAMSLAAAFAIALTFSTAMALAQTGPHVGDGTNSVTPVYPYNTGGAAAKVGDGTNSLNPYSGQAPYSYNVGSGAAHVGDGANSKLVPDQYSVAGGSAGADARQHYVAGKAQSLAPPAGMAKAEGDGK